MTLEQTVTEAASPAWMLADEEALLIGMLWHYTPSGAERALSEWLCARLAASALRLEVDAVGNFIAELPATVGMPEAPIVLLGHLDTVPGYIRVRREGERLYGRGAVDAKGPLAAFIAAALRLATSDAPRSRPVIIVGAVEEEAATSRGARAVLERWRPAYTIIGEPSFQYPLRVVPQDRPPANSVSDANISHEDSLASYSTAQMPSRHTITGKPNGASAVTLGYKGRLLVSYRIEQPVAHTARPEDSVCSRGVAFWQAVQQQAAAWNAAHVAPDSPVSFFDALMPSLRSINSGSDGFTDWCELEIGYRLPPGFDTAALEAWLSEQARAKGAQVAFRGAEVAYRGPRHGPLVSAFVRAMRQQGITPAFKLKTGTSDMNVVAPVWNCPILAYGPGDSALDHTPNEHITLPEYQQAISVLEQALIELVRVPAPQGARG